MIYQVRRCDGPDGSSLWRTQSNCRTLLGALKAVRAVRKQGGAAYVRMRLFKGNTWRGISSRDLERYAKDYNMKEWVGP